MFKKIKIILAATVLAALITGCDKKEDASSLVSTKQLTKSIQLQGVDGKKLNMTYTGSGFKFDELSNKAVLVVFFATWCPPCKEEVPHLVKLQEKYKNDFAVVAVLLEENKPNAEVEKFVKENNINYFVANSSANFDAADAFGGIRGIPTMFMFDANGKQSAYYPGATPEEVIEQDILKTIKK